MTPKVIQGGVKCELSGHDFHNWPVGSTNNHSSPSLVHHNDHLPLSISTLFATNYSHDVGKVVGI